MKKFYQVTIMLMIAMFAFTSVSFATTSPGQQKDPAGYFQHSVTGAIKYFKNGHPGDPSQWTYLGNNDGDCTGPMCLPAPKAKLCTAVNVSSLSTTAADIGNNKNGAHANSIGSSSSTGSAKHRDLKAKAVTDSFSFTYTMTGQQKTEMEGVNGRETYNAAGGYTESSALANVTAGKKRCRKPVREINTVYVAGNSNATSSIGTPNNGANGMASGVYMAIGISNDKIKASGYSDSFTQSWMGTGHTADGGNIQWSGAYSTNTTVSKVNVTEHHRGGKRD